MSLRVTFPEPVACQRVHHDVWRVATALKEKHKNAETFSVGAVRKFQQRQEMPSVGRNSQLSLAFTWDLLGYQHLVESRHY
jgi:hypothetical protein